MNRIRRASPHAADSSTRLSEHADTGNVRPPTDPTFFARLLDRIDPHRTPWDAGLWYIQLICGRWLALRRMQRNLSLAVLSEQLKLDGHVLQLLEEGAGLETPDAIAERTWNGLAARLAFEGAETASIRQIIGHALGLVTPPDYDLIDRLVDELHHADALQSAPLAVPAPPAPVAPLDANVFILLEQLIVTARHSIDLADRINKDSPTVNGLLLTMLDDGMISKTDQRVDPALDPDIALTYYRATALGQQAYAAEQSRRERERNAEPRPLPKNFATGT